MEPRIEVRDGAVHDIDQVSSLLEQTWAQAYGNVLSSDQLAHITKTLHNAEHLKRQIDNKEACFLVCTCDGAILGHAYASMKSENVLWLAKLYVLPAAQGKGMGQLLFAEICKRHPKARIAQLEVGRENANAIAFYQRNGFEKIAEVEKCGGKIDTPVFLMQAVLPK